MLSPRLRTALAVLSALALASCGGDDDDNGGPMDGIPAELAATMEPGVLGVAFVTQAAIAPAGAAAIESDTTGTAGVILAGGKSLQICPAVSFAPLEGGAILSFDYGNGCTSELDGREHSGSMRVLLTYGEGQSTYNLEPLAYTVEGFSVTANVSGIVDTASVYTQITTLDFTKPGTVVSIFSSNLNAIVDQRGTPTNFRDDQYAITGPILLSVEGAGKNGRQPLDPASANQYTAFVLTPDPEDPLIVNAGCRWPVAGTLRIDNQTTLIQITVDFCDGACDGLASVTGNLGDFEVDLDQL